MKAEGLTIILDVQGEDIDLKAQLDINEANLMGELASQPAWYAYWASLLAQANLDLEHEKGEFDSFKAEISAEIRKRLVRDEKKVTEKMVETEVFMDTRIAAKKAKLLEKKRAVAYLSVAEKAFSQRMKALETMGFLEGRQRDASRTPGQETATGRNSVQATSRQELQRELDNMSNGSSTPDNPDPELDFVTVDPAICPHPGGRKKK